MKMRRRTDSWGSSISGSFQLVEVGGGQVAEPDGHQAGDDRTDRVAAGLQPLAVTGEAEGLQAERGKRRVTAAEASHEKLPRMAAGEDAAVRCGQGGVKADDERAGDIDDQRAPWERGAKMAGHNTGQKEARHAAERAAQGDEKVEHHDRTVSGRTGTGVISLHECGAVYPCGWAESIASKTKTGERRPRQVCANWRRPGATSGRIRVFPRSCRPGRTRWLPWRSDRNRGPYPWRSSQTAGPTRWPGSGSVRPAISPFPLPGC